MQSRSVALLALAVVACDAEPAPAWRFGVNITGLHFELYDDSEGIHPSDVVLDNPRNPFRDTFIGEEAKWEILSEGGNAGGFYAWATLLARDPTGENQFYAAVKLAHIYAAGEAPEGQRETVRLMAIAAFQSVLDNFPDSVTYDATGTIPSRLATPAYLAIEELGGRPAGGWVLVATPAGGQEAVQGGDDVRPLDEVEAT
jgi:hypothetical protein